MSNDYTTLFSAMQLNEVCLGNASAFDVAISMLVVKEDMEKDLKREKERNPKQTHETFNGMFLKKAVNLFTVVEKFVQLVQNYHEKDFTDLFTYGPERYAPKGANHETLDKIPLGLLAKTLVNRVHYATCKLFYREDPNEWDPEEVTYNKLASADLVSFSTDLLKLWKEMDDEFGQKFYVLMKETATYLREHRPKIPARRDVKRDNPKQVVRRERNETNEPKKETSNAWKTGKKLISSSNEVQTSTVQTSTVESKNESKKESNNDDDEGWQTVGGSKPAWVEFKFGGRIHKVKARLNSNGNYEPVN